jgi:hypothetical protein
MDIELLYFDGCPSWQSALENLKVAIAEEKLNSKINLVKIDNPEQAVKQRYLGSPSIRIGNTDLWPEEREDYFLGCRVYPTPEGLRGWPTVEMIQQKLSAIKQRGTL